MSLYSRLIILLRDNKITFTEYAHRPVFTSEEAAAVRGTDVKQGAKAMVALADKTPLLLVISGVKKIDTKSFKRQFGIKDLHFATVEEVKEITTVSPGAVPPFGSLMSIQTYADTSLSLNDEIVFNAGDHTKSIHMHYSDYVKLENPKIATFALEQ